MPLSLNFLSGPNWRFPAGDYARYYGAGIIPAPCDLHAVEAFAYQDIHGDTAVLGFAAIGVIAGQRIRFGHAGGGQHAGRFPAAVLLNIIDYAAGAFFAYLLVQLIIDGWI